MSSERKSNAGLTIVFVGGLALLWWLLRNDEKDPCDGEDRPKPPPQPTPTPTPAPDHVAVRILSGDRVELDGELSTLPTVVAKARAARFARVRLSGDATPQWVQAVLSALRAEHINVLIDA